ncbi:MAG TPA: hypothetical protein VKZ86_10395 [Cyclobacteriaceae bacterium]|nr:hypothetical protein [Cyclobacteriaceae bacterium]HLT81430.1 hypothetical protein [Cyclobacteriaceae bacterium]
MMKVLLLAFLLSIPLTTIGQTETEVSLMDLMREIQQWNKRDNKMSMVWWIPTEYWRISLKDYGGISQETIEQVEILFEDYLVLWACDLSVNPDGTMNFASEEEIGKSITVLVGDSLEYFPLADDQIDAEVLTVAESMKPIFAQTLGQMGQGLHYYFFKVKDEDGKNLVQAKRKGEFKVSHSNAEFFWKLPLVTLMPPKFCPVDKEKMNGSWNYCPVHGKMLEN